MKDTMKQFKLSNNSTIDIFICVCSIILVLFAPSTYSYNYCLLIHCLFLLTFIYNVLKNRRDGFLTFNLLFSVSLYFTSFVYPVFIYNTSERYFSMFSYDFDEDIISYSTGVAYMAYCFLQLGLNSKDKNRIIKSRANLDYYDLERPLKVLSILFLILLVYFVFNDGLKYFSDQFIFSMSDNDRVMGYMVQFITPIAYSIIILAFLLTNKKNTTFFFAVSVVVMYALLILSTGSRTIPISIIILILFLFNDYVKKIGLVRLTALGVTFVIIMLIAGSLRGNGELIDSASISQNASELLSEKQDNIFSFADELIICNRNLYYLIGTTKTIGYTYGATIFGSFLGVVPFLSQIFLNVTGLPEATINSAKYNTALSGSLDRGLGTHAVSDVYICWGIIGVILVFYLYGFFISKFKSSNSILSNAAYYVIVSNSIYACRATIFNLNSIVWTVLIIFLIMSLFPTKKNWQ